MQELRRAQRVGGDDDDAARRRSRVRPYAGRSRTRARDAAAVGDELAAERLGTQLEPVAAAQRLEDRVDAGPDDRGRRGPCGRRPGGCRPSVLPAARRRTPRRAVPGSPRPAATRRRPATSSRAVARPRRARHRALRRGRTATRSDPYGRGVAHVQCAPMPPTHVDAAAAGMPALPGSSRCVPWRAVTVPSTIGMPTSTGACGGPWERSRASRSCSSSSRFFRFSPGGSVSTGPASTIRMRACGSRSETMRANVAPTGPLPTTSRSQLMRPPPRPGSRARRW